MYINDGYMSLINNVFENIATTSSRHVLHYAGKIEARNNRFLQTNGAIAIDLALGLADSPKITSQDNYFSNSANAFAFDTVIPTSSNNIYLRHIAKTGTTTAVNSLTLDLNFDTYRISGTTTINTIEIQNSATTKYLSGSITLLPEPDSAWAFGSSGNIVADSGARKPNQAITLQYSVDRNSWFEVGGRVAGSGTVGQV